ncbi:2-dehydropantoate 2-reductase [Hyaloscypha variabilis F]|jgi:2-dehydropantoate 2-reductase|uniref:2-dehydropantoate 2-reductase n=1 Tax=Hyaloscypha variabilis (strain UAMH 11265 / GT02V1 / F) TaxID=1149755 RepID=A0A2J6QR81_HYAVF|nr:2-dehydropantoate 2-reductase [Hyaloscypha variabilis F]PMD29042.1 2-dehydropantoate 2-reductase [Hyaloscypha variabilis F]
MARILIFGSGNVGTVYAMILHMAGAEVTCVCRSTFDVAKSDGFTVHSTVFGDHTFFPTVVASVQEAVDANKSLAFDYVVDCTKALASSSSPPASLIRPAIRIGHTGIVVIKNGIGVERPYREAFPDNTIISGVTYLPTSQITPGIVSHTETQKLHLGRFPAGDATAAPCTKTMSFAKLIWAGGAEATVHIDIQIERWKKLIGNATWNPICALSRCRDLEFLRASDMATSFVIQAMHEVVSVAAALGFSEFVQASAVETQVQRSAARSWPGVEPSMMSDMKYGRPMEVEAIIGEVVRLGKDNNVDVPRLETLYVLLMGLNWSAQPTGL